MDRKLRTKRGRTLYRQRGAAVEPVFGQMKDRQGADRFSMRGLECCRSEWQLDAAVHNLRKLHRESVHRAKTKQPSPIRRGVQYGSIGNRLRSSAASLFRSSSSPFLENQATRAPEISRPVGQRPRAGHRTSSPSPTSSALRFASRRGFGSPKGTIKIHDELRPKLATPNKVRLDLRTMVLRDYGKPGGIPALVDAPHAGHTAVIADYHKGQSLVETLLANGIGHVALTDWKSATPDMKDFEIDNYLAEMIIAIDDLGGRVNLVGLCQGGWLSAMVAARFPDKVNALVLAGTPIDADAGDGPIKRMAKTLPLAFYKDLVGLGGGLMKGKFMLQGWKNMHPEQHYIQDHVDLYEHIDDPAYLEKEETFNRWYENPLDLPGRWYLEAIEQITPIRLTHSPSRCSVIPVAGIKLGIGRRLCVASDAEQRTEGVE